MLVNRKRTRKLLFQELYARKFNVFNEEEFYNSFYDWKFTFNIDKDYINEITEIIEIRKDFFNTIIKEYAPKFDIESMSIIYLIPIYIALSEMFFLKEEIPAKVSINEAIEITKTYGDDSWKKIVNWILNKVLKNFEKLKKEIN